MNILIIYATTEGQTRKICRFAADHLTAQGHSVELVQVADAEGLEVARFDAAILAGSVHIGRVQKALTDYANVAGAKFAKLRTLYLQVSLAAAGNDPEELADLDKIAAAAAADFGWTPGRTEQIAGAFRFTQYDFLKSWAMRWIASQKGERVDPQADKEYTDWEALRAILDEWVAQAASSPPGSDRR